MAEEQTEQTERTKAIRGILAVLRSPLALMSIPTRMEAMLKADEYHITARELLEATLGAAKNA